MIRRKWAPLVAGVVFLLPFSFYGIQGCFWPQVANDGLVDAGKAEVSFPGDGGDAYFVGPGAACNTAAGSIPQPNCLVPPSSGLSCTNMSKVCAVTKTADDASCGEPLCLPMADNSDAGVKNFRMSAIHIAAPSALTGLVQNVVITGGVTPNVPTCGYGKSQGLSGGSGNGLFNWLLSVDLANKTLTTGGAPFVSDPYKDGFCYVDTTVHPEGGAPIAIGPLDASIQVDGSTFSMPAIKGTLNIPVFTMAGGSPIILPIDSAALNDVTISPDGNCIGDINPAWYANAGSACQDQALSTCPQWFTNGSLTGFMSGKAANAVPVPGLGGTLCGILCPTAGLGSTCTAAEETSCGDYCSTTHMPGGCNDSFWLSATFAANAAKINPTGPAPCKP
jgi:hypothetical protein